MIEIILRDDVSDYDPKPVFGYSYRTAATGILLAVACGGLGYLGATAGVPDSLLGPVLVALGGLIGFLGIGRPGSLRAEQWLRAWDWDRRWPRHALYASPELAVFRRGDEAGKASQKSGRGKAAPELEVEEVVDGD